MIIDGFCYFPWSVLIGKCPDLPTLENVTTVNINLMKAHLWKVGNCIEFKIKNATGSKKEQNVMNSFLSKYL